jgi:hypothetical protein
MLSVSTTSTAKKPPTTETTTDLAGNLLTIAKGGKVEVYDLREFPTSWDGRAFELVKKSTGEKYSTFIALNPQDHVCDCHGHEAKSYCKHVDALTQLWAAGWLERREQHAPEQIAGPDPFDPQADLRPVAPAATLVVELNDAPMTLTVGVLTTPPGGQPAPAAKYARSGESIAREALEDATHWYYHNNPSESWSVPAWVTLADIALKQFAAEDAKRDRWADQQESESTARQRVA